MPAVPGRVRWYGTIGELPVPESLLSPFPPSSARPEWHWLGPALAFAGAFGFSAKAIFAKLAYAASTVDAITVLTFRMIFSLPFFALMIWVAQRDAMRTRLSRRDWAAIVWLGFIGYYLASLLDFLGLEYISASLERLILFLNPTIVVLLSALVLGKPITRRIAAALALSYAGIVLVFAHDFHLARETATLLIGGGLVFASAITYAIYLVGNGEIIQRVGAARFTAYGMSVSTVFVFLQFLLTRPLSALHQPATVYWTIAGMAVFSTVLPIWLTNEAIRRIGSNRVALIGTIGPVLTIGLGAIFLGEAITLFQIGGAALVMAGVVLVTLKR
jgi:drug/metabolite transporter (DMT)-like permease